MKIVIITSKIIKNQFFDSPENNYLLVIYFLSDSFYLMFCNLCSWILNKNMQNLNRTQKVKLYDFSFSNSFTRTQKFPVGS